MTGRAQDQELKLGWLENVRTNRKILAACAQ